MFYRGFNDTVMPDYRIDWQLWNRVCLDSPAMPRYYETVLTLVIVKSQLTGCSVSGLLEYYKTLMLNGCSNTDALRLIKNIRDKEHFKYAMFYLSRYAIVQNSLSKTESQRKELDRWIRKYLA
jgi:hypothetical protein